MKTYYATATNSKGASFLITNLSDHHAEASGQAERHCKKNGLTFEALRVQKGTNDSSTVLTKNAKKRKAIRGVNGYKETH